MHQSNLRKSWDCATVQRKRTGCQEGPQQTRTGTVRQTCKTTNRIIFGQPVITKAHEQSFTSNWVPAVIEQQVTPRRYFKAGNRELRMDS